MRFLKPYLLQWGSAIREEKHNEKFFLNTSFASYNLRFFFQN